MLATKPKASLAETSNHKEPANSSSSSNYSRAHASAPRVSRLAKPAASAGSSKQAAEARAPSPLHNAARAAAAVPLDKSVDAVQKPSPAERRSNSKASPHRTSTTPDVRQKTPDKRQPRIAKASELQAQLNLVHEDLKNAREHLANIDKDRAQVHDDLALTKTLADEAYQKLEESLAAQRRAEDALELERFKAVEREQASIELARREEEWQRKHADVTKRHAQDVNSLAKVTKELENAKGELAVIAQAKNSALSRVDEAEKTAQGIAKRMEILTAEVTRLKSEMGSREKEAEEIIDKLRSEASELRAELQRAMAFQEKLVRAEEVVEGLKVDIAYAKRAEMDADQSAQGWETKAAALEDRLAAITSLNKSNQEALASLTKSFKEAQSQLLQMTEKAAASECEASQYKEGFLETNRRLDIVRKEASELQATIHSLRSEHELLNEAHQQVVSNEKAASLQVSALRGDKVRLQQELHETREERDKAKKGVEDVVAALRQVSAEAREAKERVLAKQTELDHAQLQISELKTATKNAGDKHQLMLHESNCLKEKVEMLGSEAKNAKEKYELILDESNHLKKTVERLGSEAKILQDDRVSKEVWFAETLRRSEEETSYIKSEMSKLMESLAAAEKEVQKLKAEKTQLVHKLEEGSGRTAMDAPRSSAEQSMVAESSHLKDLLSTKEQEVLALDHQVTELRHREAAALAKADEALRLMDAASSSAEKSMVAERSHLKDLLSTKEQEVLALDHQVTELRRREAAALAKADEALRLMDAASSSAEKSMVAERSHLKDLLSTKEQEVLALDHQVTELRRREAAALAKADEALRLMDAASSSAEKSMVAERSHLKDLLSTKEQEVLALDHQVTELRLREAAALAKADEASKMMDAASSSAEQSMVAECSHLKDLLSTKEKEVLALGDQVTELRLREAAALAKADETSKLLAEATARKAGEEEAARSADKSNALLVKLEMDTMLQSQIAAEHEAKDAKDSMAQLQSKLRLVESKITEANLTAEEEKISSLRLKETLAEKDEELQSIARENDGLRTREAAARAKADELAAMLAEATAMKGGDQSAGRSPEKQPNVFRKMMCSPMDNVARGDHESRRNSDRIVQVLEEIKHVEVETVRQVKHERELSVEANSMENSKILEDDLCKGMLSNGVDTESSEDDDIDSQGEDGAADQTGGLLMHRPRSSFKQEHHSHKKKKALLRKFGSMLKKKAHFTKLNKHS